MGPCADAVALLLAVLASLCVLHEFFYSRANNISRMQVLSLAPEALFFSKKRACLFGHELQMEGFFLARPHTLPTARTTPKG